MRIRYLTITLAGLSVLTLCPARAAAEEAKSPPPAAKTEATPTTGAVARGKDTLSVDFPEEEIRTVLRNVADLFELNLVIPDTLQGKTSVKLRDVTWRQIYRVVLEPVGYTFVEDSNIIKVVTIESLNLEPLATEVFVLNYSKASEVKPSIDSLIDAKLGGKIVVDSRSNALVVTERPSAIQRIRPIIMNLDRATDQVMIESKFIEVDDGNAKDLGVNWSSLKNYNITGGPFSRNYGDTRSSSNGTGVNNSSNTNNLNSNSSGNTTGNTNNLTENNINVPFMTDGYNRAGQLAGVPIGPPYTVDSTTGLRTYPNLGPASQLTNTTGSTSSNSVSSTLSTLLGTSLTSAFSNGVTASSTAVFSADKFGILLSALQSLNNTKLVSNPTVVTLNNNEASINVGEEYPVPNYTYNQEHGSFEVSGFTYKSIGVILKVTPQVNTAGFIKLTVEPEVSSRTGTANFGGAAGAQIPIIGVSKARTQVTIKDGYTLGLGGMVRSTRNKTQTKVPLLGDIPGLGRLFRNDSTDSSTTNLVIFLTARTIKPDGASVGEIFDPRMIREMKITKDELPGFRDGSDPFYQPPVVEEKKDKK